MTDPMAALRSAFVARCRTDLAELRRLGDRGDTAEVGALVHRLAGAAGSFGFPEVSASALVVDQQIRDGGAASQADMERLLGLLTDLAGAEDSRAPPHPG